MLETGVEEIFASIQGEGPWVGQRHIFVRFHGCDIACRYCDTPGTKHDLHNEKNCRAQISAASFQYVRIECNISPTELTDYCSRLIIPGPGRPILSLTGGEPLLHRSFLTAWLPDIKNTYTVYLETNGIHDSAMSDLRNMVDVVSMDFKLPSATGLRPFWSEHRRFLAACRGKSIFVKAVITADTVKQDILASAQLIAENDPTIPLIIQPAWGSLAPEETLLIEYQNAALALIADVRVIPQAHKVLKLP